jgi:hypothetical protein
VEGRAGLGWAGAGSTHGVLGAAVGYDVGLGALGTGVYGGVEQMIEAPTSAATRAGHLGPDRRAGAGAGQPLCHRGLSLWQRAERYFAGRGYQQSLGPVYARLEYRRYFNEQHASDSNGLMLGVGLKF